MLPITGDGGVDDEGPGVDAAGHGVDVCKALLAKEVGDAEGAGAVVAEDDEGLVFEGCKFFFEAGLEFVHGDEEGAIDVGFFEFVGAADVQKCWFGGGLEALLDLGGVDFPFGVDFEFDAVGGGFGFGRHGGLQRAMRVRFGQGIVCGGEMEVVDA